MNYGTIGLTPALLASALAVGAIVALGLTLAASVRRRRRDLALLKTLGFTQRQLMAAVAWQASVAAVIGIVIGVPLGIVVGRWLWSLFARQIYAVPQPSVPVLSVVLVALGALVLANSLPPGRGSSRPGHRRPCCCGLTERGEGLVGAGAHWSGRIGRTPRTRQERFSSEAKNK